MNLRLTLMHSEPMAKGYRPSKLSDDDSVEDSANRNSRQGHYKLEGIALDPTTQQSMGRVRLIHRYAIASYPVSRKECFPLRTYYSLVKC